MRTLIVALTLAAAIAIPATATAQTSCTGKHRCRASWTVNGNGSVRGQVPNAYPQGTPLAFCTYINGRVITNSYVLGTNALLYENKGTSITVSLRGKHPRLRIANFDPSQKRVTFVYYVDNGNGDEQC